jgi:hypothetical protein
LHCGETVVRLVPLPPAMRALHGGLRWLTLSGIVVLCAPCLPCSSAWFSSNKLSGTLPTAIATLKAIECVAVARGLPTSIDLFNESRGVQDAVVLQQPLRGTSAWVALHTHDAQVRAQSCRVSCLRSCGVLKARH